MSTAKSTKAGLLNIEQIIPFDDNPRTNDGAVGSVKTSILAHGYRDWIEVDENNVVLAGHTRLKALQAIIEERGSLDDVIGLQGGKIPVLIHIGMSDADKRTYSIANNRTGEFAEWDFDKLRLIVDGLDTEELKAMDFDLSELTGFDFDELNKDKEPPEEPPTPEPPEKPKSKRGEIWLLGDHRVMCGDATSKDDVDKLMDGKKADMVFTDPPYNVDFKDHFIGSKIQGDKQSSEQFRLFIKQSIKNLWHSTINNAACYLCFATLSIRDILWAIDNTEWEINQWIIWVKDIGSRQLTHSYRWRFEPIMYLVKNKLPNFYSQIGSKTNVWEFPSSISMASIKDDGGKGIHLQHESFHPNRKPLELSKEAIANSCPSNGFIIDLFGGSGSTLIACEQTNRKCYMMEIDPHYIDVILDRWMKYTGKIPVRSDGKKWVSSDTTTKKRKPNPNAKR